MSMVNATAELLVSVPDAKARYALRRILDTYISTDGGSYAGKVDFNGPISFKNSLNVLSDIRRANLSNNLRANAVMASPPTCTVVRLWTASTAYALNEYVVNISGSGAATIGRYYKCTTAGTSASSGGPTGTGTGIADGTAVFDYDATAGHGTVSTAKFGTGSSANSYNFGNSTGTGLAGLTNGVVDFLGGVPAINVSTGGCSVYGATVVGVYSPGSPRWRFVTDATKPIIRIFDVAASAAFRFIVDVGAGPQYASLTPISITAGGWKYLQLDFTSVGGRAMREITIECQSNTSFAAVDVGLTEGVYKPGLSKNAFGLVVAGDSFSVSAGATNFWDGVMPVVGDILGAYTVNMTGIGGTGYLNTSTSGTARSRVRDVINSCAVVQNPVIIDENIYNDSGFTPAAITAEAILYYQAIRAGVGPNVPIFAWGCIAAMNGGNAAATQISIENAKQAAVTAMNDPLIFFVPCMGAPGGSPMTGTGNDQTTNGTGNSDIYTNGLTLPHSNTAGHNFMARACWVPGMVRSIVAAGY